MADIVEGRNAVEEALRAGRAPERILMAEGAKPHPELESIAALAQAAGIKVERVARYELDRLSERGAHQGVIAYVEPYRYASLDDILARAGDGASLIVVLDHVMDPGNLGAAVRSAAAAGADGLIVADRRSAPMSAVALKAAAGGADRIPVARVTNLSRALEKLKDAGYWVAGAAGEIGESMWRAPLEGRLVLVLGSEGSGLSRLVAEHCDLLVTIPMASGMQSLNVAQALTVLSYEWLRRSSAEVNEVGAKVRRLS